MKSEWMKNRKLLKKQLNQDIECDVLIVGAGMSGLLCAYQLKNLFDRVVIIESDEIAFGASGRSTGKLSSQHGLNLQEIYRIHGEEKTKLYYQENEKSIQGIKEIIDEYQITCDFTRKDSIVGCKSEKRRKNIDREIEVYEKCGISYEKVNECYEMKYGVKFKNQASFDPYQFCIQLAEKMNIEIYENTPMTQMNYHTIKTNEYHIQYKYCILATQVMPFQFQLFYAITKPNSSLLAALSPSSNSNQMILIDDDITKTENEMYEFQLIGGYDHPLNEDRDMNWKKFKRDLVCEYPNHKILSTWSSQDYEVFDYLPIVDQYDDFIVITGFNKWGNTNSFVASLVVKDIIMNENTNRRELFQLKRKSLIFNKKIITENIQVLKSLIESKLDSSEIKIPNHDEAITFKVNHHPYGIYRIEECLYIVDIRCPHLGCTLKYNENERTWDCPCHGSRFSISGEIIKGPALVSLKNNHCKIDDLK